MESFDNPASVPGSESGPQSQSLPRARPPSGAYKLDSDPPASPGTAITPGTENPFTRLVVALNALIFAAMVIGSGGQAFLEPSTTTLVAWGANYGPLTFFGQYFRIITCTFVHVGVIHIAMNMYVFWDIGNLTEQLFGTRKIAMIYILAAVGGSLASLFFNPSVLSAGASGAVFGVYGALLAMFWRHKHFFKPKFLQVASRSIVFFVIFNLAYGAARPGIDNAAHVGGLVSGFLSGLVLLPMAPADYKGNRGRDLKLLPLFALAVVGLTLLVQAHFFADFKTQAARHLASLKTFLETVSPAVRQENKLAETIVASRPPLPVEFGQKLESNRAAIENVVAFDPDTAMIKADLLAALSHLDRLLETSDSAEFEKYKQGMQKYSQDIVRTEQRYLSAFKPNGYNPTVLH